MVVAKGEGVGDEATCREYVEGVGGGWGEVGVGTISMVGTRACNRLLCNTEVH